MYEFILNEKSDCEALPMGDRPVLLQFILHNYLAIPLPYFH
ncbi:hypothetical protein [Cylindrospermopsis raciborskii]|nr:hypothetical protein [Cylindrospermopsis raciborskii]